MFRYGLFVVFLVAAFASSAVAQNFSATQTLNQIYDAYQVTCTVDADADNGEHNRVSMAAGRRYLVWCTDSTDFTSVACRCKQGTSTVDVTSGTSDGVLVYENQQLFLLQKSGDTHISCDPESDNSHIHVCAVQ